MSAFLLSIAVIFVAELGDKSQLMAMTFATRFRARDVLIGITAATALVHLLSVALGAAVGAALPTTAISVVAGLAFLGFAAWTLRGDRLDEDERSKAAPGHLGGDPRGRRRVLPGRARRQDDARHDHAGHPRRTGSAPGSAARSAWWPPTRWRSSVGAALGRRLPEKTIRYGAAAAFAVFGVLLLATAAA